MLPFPWRSLFLSRKTVLLSRVTKKLLMGWLCNFVLYRHKCFTHSPWENNFFCGELCVPKQPDRMTKGSVWGCAVMNSKNSYQWRGGCRMSEHPICQQLLAFCNFWRWCVECNQIRFRRQGSIFLKESQSCNNRSGNFEIFVFKLSLSKKTMLLRKCRCCVTAEHENLCSVEPWLGCVSHIRCVWPLHSPVCTGIRGEGGWSVKWARPWILWSGNYTGRW